jgi:hypothetical protein
VKNFPHQFNDLEKLYGALRIINELIDANTKLTDESLGERLTREGIYTYRKQDLTVEQYLKKEQQKPTSNRGYLTVARDIRRFFDLLGFITVSSDKSATLSPAAIQLLAEDSVEARKLLWKNALMQLSLAGDDGRVSHPYRILLKIVRSFPGIETKKLMLALEAEDDSDEEFARISALAGRKVEEIIEITGTSRSMAANAIKILPGLAEQLGDINRSKNHTYPIGDVIATEDEILTEEIATPERARTEYRAVDPADIAADPHLREVVSTSVDLAEAIRLRQKRLSEHQQLVRELAAVLASGGFDNFFDGKFDCLAIKDGRGLLFEVKTLSGSVSDEERQTVKGVGQLKYYNFSIIRQQMGYEHVGLIIAYSRRPSDRIIQFCKSEKIIVIWKDANGFSISGSDDENYLPFDPGTLIN